MIIKNSESSALLLVFVIAFILTLSTMRCWHVASLICDVQNQRELYYKHFYQAEKVLDFGIELACKNFDRFLKFKNPMEINVDGCLSDEQVRVGFEGKFLVSKVTKKDILLLSASLMNKNEVKCNLKCMLERKLGIKSEKNNDKNKIYFIVNNFTLSASL